MVFEEWEAVGIQLCSGDWDQQEDLDLEQLKNEANSVKYWLEEWLKLNNLPANPQVRLICDWS